MTAASRSVAWLGCVALILSTAAAARADLIYNDTISPDLSNDYQNPTPFNLPVGTSSITMRTYVNQDFLVDVDLFRINLPVGGALTHVYLKAFQGNSSTSFIAFQQGASMTFDPLGNGGIDAYKCLDECLGGDHFGSGAGDGMQIGGDLLVGGSEFNGMDDGVRSHSFVPPLTAQQYTFWVQEFNGDVTLTLDFVVSPEPATAMLSVLGVAGVCLFSRRRNLLSR